MSVSDYLLALIRLALLVGPAIVGVDAVRRTWVPVLARSQALLVDAVGTVAAVIVAAELLGLLSVDRWWSLTVLLALAAVTALALTRGRARPAGQAQLPPAPQPGLLTTGAAVAAVIVVGGQWTVLTADALGGGILSFDSLWYHLPFAAAFAQSGSVSHVLFTQADPFVAYYPANSELLHAVGMLATSSDLLSPMLNVLWLAVALLAAWCIGLRWGAQLQTLVAGSVVAGVPVLSATQPGSAFNDMAGLASLLAAAALICCANGGAGILIVAGLAAGLALGTKLTFAAPAAVMILGFAAAAGRGRRLRTLALLGVPCLLVGGWWYLRALIDTGSPLGLSLHIGPLHLSGPSSPLADQASQTVISALGETHLWGSRLAPGLSSAFGPVWPVLVVLAGLGIIAGLILPVRAVVRVLAAAGLVAALAYLVVPTGASAIEQQTQLFALNLRYATPALALGMLAGVLVLAQRRPAWLPGTGLLLLAVLLVTQLNRQLWRTQPGRHAAFLVAVALAVAAGWGMARLRHRRGPALAAALAGAVVICVGAGLVVERHYFARRYLTAAASTGPLGQIYRWAQGVSHARVALYGTVEQYPLFGARVTNRVVYLGQPAARGGYQPIRGCSGWRAALRRGGFQYLVFTPGPTAAIPASWTQGDRAATLVMAPSHGYAVYRLDPTAVPASCPGR